MKHLLVVLLLMYLHKRTCEYVTCNFLETGYGDLSFVNGPADIVPLIRAGTPASGESAAADSFEPLILSIPVW